MKGKGWVAAAACAALIAGGFFAAREWYDRKVPNFTESIDCYVVPGESAWDLADSLAASGSVKRPGSLRRAFKAEAVEEGLRVGHYTVPATASSRYVARMFTHGWQTPVNMTLSGAIRSPRALARKIGAQMLADSAAVASFVLSDDSLSRYGVDTTLLFTIVIPDTYQIYWTAPVGEIMDRLALAADKFWTPERLRKAKALGLTRQEVVTLASIVDGETRYVPEQPTIAGVYLNRLRKGMKLQADPTVAYCYGYTLNRIFKSHLSIDSPYNTYKYAGLPPGPISCPPKSCLEAVLDPDVHSYIFFCANPAFNGSHLFATTYSEHLVNARAFQKALTKRLAERAANSAAK